MNNENLQRICEFNTYFNFVSTHKYHSFSQNRQKRLHRFQIVSFHCFHEYFEKKFEKNYNHKIRSRREKK